MQKQIHPKTTSSPIIRRLRKTSANNTGPSQKHPTPAQNIRKSVSLINMSDKLVETSEEYPDKSNEANSAVSQEFADTATTDNSDNNLNILEKLSTDAGFQEAMRKVDLNGNPASSTLPRSLTRGKSITRSLVPKMRKIFEKSRSCDPELPHLKIRINSDQPQAAGNGTESARSSFVMLGPDTCHESRGDDSVSSSILSYDDSQLGREELKQKGFLDKCANKFKFFMGKNQEKE